MAVIVGHRNVFVFSKKELKATENFDDGACIALSRDGKLVAVGSLVRQNFLSNRGIQPTI